MSSVAKRNCMVLSALEASKPKETALRPNEFSTHQEASEERLETAQLAVGIRKQRSRRAALGTKAEIYMYRAHLIRMPLFQNRRNGRPSSTRIGKLRQNVQHLGGGTLSELLWVRSRGEQTTMYQSQCSHGS